MLSRKDRKRNRKKPPIIHLSPSEDKALWELAKRLTMAPRHGKENKIFFDGERGCYNFTGGRSYCQGCHYNRGGIGCHKWETMEVLWEKER